jgi:hypothetical protein
MARAYNVVDADGHILEPLDLWDNSIDPEFSERRPRRPSASTASRTTARRGTCSASVSGRCPPRRNTRSSPVVPSASTV